MTDKPESLYVSAQDAGIDVRGSAMSADEARLESLLDVASYYEQGADGPAILQKFVGVGSELARLTADGDATIHWAAVEQAAKQDNHFLSAMAKLLIAARDTGANNAPAVPEGFELVAVKGFSDLMYWLERCENKGHLENCPDLVEPWAAFEYRNVATPAKPAQEVAEALQTAIRRIEDILNNDDGQAWKEAQKALPRLHEVMSKALRAKGGAQ